MIRLILFLSRCTFWAQARKVLRYPLNWTDWCRRLSYFRRKLQEKRQWHIPHAVQYSPTCIHRTPTQGTRTTYCTPKVLRPERRCPTSCCWRLWPIPFRKRLAVSNETRVDENLQHWRMETDLPLGVASQLRTTIQIHPNVFKPGLGTVIRTVIWARFL